MSYHCLLQLEIYEWNLPGFILLQGSQYGCILPYQVYHNEPFLTWEHNECWYTKPTPVLGIPSLCQHGTGMRSSTKIVKTFLVVCNLRLIKYNSSTDLLQ